LTVGAKIFLAPGRKILITGNYLILRPGLHLAYTHRRKVEKQLNTNSRPEIFWQCNQDTEPELH